MDRLLARLERTFLGRLAIERLTTFLVGGMAITYVLLLIGRINILTVALLPAFVPAQPWRLVTFLFMPPPGAGMLLMFFALSFTWTIGSSLESEWGALKLNIFYFFGAVCAIAAAFVTNSVGTNIYLNLSLYFAFATLFPDYVIRLFLVVPIKVKYAAGFAAAYVAYEFVRGGTSTRVAIAFAMGNYLLFFAGHIIALLKGRRMLVRQAARRAEQRPRAEEDEVEERACAICGAKQSDGADIRVCSCEKCGGKPRQLCLEHARNH